MMRQNVKHTPSAPYDTVACGRISMHCLSMLVEVSDVAYVYIIQEVILQMYFCTVFLSLITEEILHVIIVLL